MENVPGLYKGKLQTCEETNQRSGDVGSLSCTASEKLSLQLSDLLSLPTMAPREIPPTKGAPGSAAVEKKDEKASSGPPQRGKGLESRLLKKISFYSMQVPAAVWNITYAKNYTVYLQFGRTAPAVFLGADAGSLTLVPCTRNGDSP